MNAQDLYDYLLELKGEGINLEDMVCVVRGYSESSIVYAPDNDPSRVKMIREKYGLGLFEEEGVIVLAWQPYIQKLPG